MEKIAGSIYDYPKCYDLVYGSDWKAEFDFLEACFERFCSQKVKELFEPACGTGRLVFRFAKAGYKVFGSDLNEKAIDFCNDRLQRHGFPETAVVADMSKHILDKPVDAAFNTINSFRHLSTEKQARNHLECVSKSLKRGGIYALGLHIYPTNGETIDSEAWTARRGNLQVNTQMRLAKRDLKNRQEHFSMSFEVYTPTRFFQINDRLIFRTYTAAQMKKLIASVGKFEIVAAFDFSYEIDSPLEIDETSEDVVYILKKM